MSYDYLAGLIDGEGYVGIRKTEKKKDGSLIPEYKPTVVIANTNYKIMKVLSANFAGCVCAKKHPNKIGWKDSYSFEFNRKEIRNIIPHIVKKLIIKKEQLECVEKLFDSYRKVFRGNGYSKEEVVLKESLYSQCLNLNKRGNENIKNN